MNENDPTVHERLKETATAFGVVASIPWILASWVAAVEAIRWLVTR